VTPASSAARFFDLCDMPDGGRLFVRPEYRASLADPVLWDRSPRGAEAGRGTVRVARVRTENGPDSPFVRVVLRPYRHGGTLRLVTRDLFRSPRRGVQEIECAAWLREIGIPTVDVLALRLRRTRFRLWRMTLATRAIEGGTDLLSYARTGVVAGEPVPARLVVAAVANLLRRLHEEGVRHRDLHLGNLLVTGARAPRGVVIDLDKCEVRRGLSEDLRRDALARLYRSLRKCEVACGRAHLHRAGLARFLRLYSGERWRDDWHAVARRIRRGYPLHRFAWRVGTILRSVVGGRMRGAGAPVGPAEGSAEVPPCPGNRSPESPPPSPS
jgi:tRNA A-37 threonylcarbamoyl transferase component Bud32